MLITNIEKTKKGRFSIFVDDEFYCALHVEVFALSGIRINEDFPQEKLEELKKESERKITRDRALKLLSAKDYSKKNLIEKLLKYGEEDICKETADKMEDLGLINDYDYAMRLARDLHNLKGYGNNRIKMYLFEKGINHAIADEAVSQFDDDEQHEKIMEILIKKCKTDLTDRKEKEKMFAKLMRMGYKSGEIKTAINEFIENEQQEM